MNTIRVTLPILARELAESLQLKPFALIYDLMEMNVFCSINEPIEKEVARKICEKRGMKLQIVPSYRNEELPPYW